MSAAPTEPIPPQPAAGRGLRLAILSGLLLAAAHPAIGLWPLAWVALVPLLISLERARSLRQAAWRGYCFGWAFLGPTWYWTGLTIVAWTHSQIGWFAWFGLTMILALFYGLFGGAAWWIGRRTSGNGRLLAVAAAWVIVEWARTLGALTMPWAQLSYSQATVLPIIQVAELTGAYGISFLMLIVNGAAATRWTGPREGDRRESWLAGTLVLMTLLYGMARLAAPETGRELPVAAMQDNFGVGDMRGSAFSAFRTFDELTAQASSRAVQPRLYIWAESSAPRDAIHDSLTREHLAGLAEAVHAPIVVGARVEDRRAGTESNASILFAPGDRHIGRYNKRQLVPFGEFIPFRQQLPSFLDETFGFPKSDVAPGSGPTLLPFQDPQVGPVNLGPFICYESMYPGYAREMTDEGADLLITQSNDDWFQSLAAMEQHLDAVRLRAVENRRSVVRSTTTGITCVIDSRGRVVERAQIKTAGFVAAIVRLPTGRTLYTRCGDWFVLLCALGLARLWIRDRQSRGGAA